MKLKRVDPPVMSLYNQLITPETVRRTHTHHTHTDRSSVQVTCLPESLDPYGGMIPLQGMFDELA